MLSICFAIFFIHAILMGLDEFGFHLKRNLTSSEKWSRPLETLCLMGCFSFVLWAPLNLPALWFYLTLAISSIVFSLRDEFLRQNTPVSHEKTVHILLFLNQPLVFIVNALFWLVLRSANPAPFLMSFKNHEGLIRDFLFFQAIIAACFFIYQLVSWKRKIRETETKEPSEGE